VSGINRTRVGDHPNTRRRSPEEEKPGFTRNNTPSVRPSGFEPETCGLRVRSRLCLLNPDDARPLLTRSFASPDEPPSCSWRAEIWGGYGMTVQGGQRFPRKLLGPPRLRGATARRISRHATRLCSITPGRGEPPFRQAAGARLGPRTHPGFGRETQATRDRRSSRRSALSSRPTARRASHRPAPPRGTPGAPRSPRRGPYGIFRTPGRSRMHRRLYPRRLLARTTRGAVGNLRATGAPHRIQGTSARP